MTIKGIDVSHWQGNIDYKKVKASGIEFVFIKASQGTSIKDSMFETNYKNATASGLKVGAYHFGTFYDQASAKKEADYFLSVIKGKTFTYPIVLDLEQDKKNVSDKQLTDAAITFLETLESAGYFAMFYSGKSFIEGELETNRLKPYAQWIARYGSELGYEAGIWQYSQSGKVSGISGSVDMNIAYHDYTFTSPKQKPVASKTVIKTAPKPIYHKVVSGDNLTDLAVKYHTTVPALVSLNHLKNANTIYAGETLRVK